MQRKRQKCKFHRSCWGLQEEESSKISQKKTYQQQQQLMLALAVIIRLPTQVITVLQIKQFNRLRCMRMQNA